MEANLHVKFYTSAAKKQNMWIEQEGGEGIRYEVDGMEDIKKCFQDYIEQLVDVGER